MRRGFRKGIRFVQSRARHRLLDKKAPHPTAASLKQDKQLINRIYSRPQSFDYRHSRRADYPGANEPRIDQRFRDSNAPKSFPHPLRFLIHL